MEQMRNYTRHGLGFTLVEIMIVVAVIGVLAAVALPNYQRYVKSTKRADMMSEMQNIATRIESDKLIAGSYSKVNTTNFAGDYPKSGNANYTVALSPIDTNKLLTSADWKITATPKGSMAGDDNLTLDATGVKCWGTKCGKGDEWR